jgi:long-chain acyl-CoA synthetase
MRDSSTILHRLYLWSQDQPNQPAHYFRPDPNQWKSISAQSLWLQVCRIALYLIEQGIAPGDRVLIYASNSPEWIQWELGTVLAGGVSVGVHPGIAEVELRQILSEAEPRWIISESSGFSEIVQRLFVNSGLNSSSSSSIAMTFAEAAQTMIQTTLTDDTLVDARGVKLLQGFDPNVAQFIVYTSGTTGKPKGVMLSLKHLSSVADVLAREWNLTFMDGTLYSFLPLAHVAEKVQSLAVALSLRYPVWFNSSYDRFVEEMREVQPTILLAVPRVWEKLREAVENHKPKLLQRVKELRIIGPMAERIYLSQIRQQLGLDRLVLAVSGAAKLSPWIGEWFKEIDIEIQEIYGMSETTGVLTLTHPGRRDFSLVGRPAAGFELTLSPDGEVWAKGPLVFMGYYRDPVATAEVLLREGWLKTGDLGEWKPNADGTPELHLIGRNRDIIKLSNGKMVAPVQIENVLKGIPEISNVCIVGEGRSHLIALITLQESVLMDLRFVPGAIEGLSVEDEVLRQKVKAAILKFNEDGALSFPLTHFVLLSREFSVEKGEVTATQKLNRIKIQENFKFYLELFHPT